jgi:two-component sensor histidine kinase/ligand-binding sensor domain-containing protein
MSIIYLLKPKTAARMKKYFNCKHLLFITILSFAYIPGLIAQGNDIIFSHLTSADGLSMNTVNCMIQDSRGFIWIGTPNGLNRYDGYTFKIFTPDPEDPYCISDFIITCLAEDSQGNIWVGTPEGLNKYDWKSEKFFVYKNDPQDKNSLSNNYIFSLLEDKTGTLWVGTLDGLNKYNVSLNNFTVNKLISDKLNPEKLNSVTGMIESYKGDFWLSTWNGLTCMQKDGKILKVLFPTPKINNIITYRFSSLVFEDHYKNLWIGTNGKGLIRYNQRTGELTNFSSSPGNPATISNNYITSILEDQSENLWIATSFGLNKFNRAKNNFTRILNNYQISSSLINNSINSLMQDHDRLIWVGTHAGISKFFQSDNKFIHLNQYDKKTGQPLMSDRVISVFIDNNDNIWLGTIDGLFEVTGKARRIVNFKNGIGNGNSIKGDFIRSVFVDSKGIIWIGTNDSGLNMYDPETGKFKLFTYNSADDNTISNNGITSICEDNNGNLWLGTWWGLDCYNRKSGHFKRYFTRMSQSDSSTISNSFIWDVFKDSQGLIWVGTNGGGVCRINTNTNKITVFSSDIKNKYYISNNNVSTIFESKDGMLWFGTINGLNSFNPITGKTTVYTKKDGLPGYVINGIQEDDKKFLWIGTDKGLSKFDRKSGIFYNYNKKEGLSALEFVQNVAQKSKDGTLYFGLNGLMCFNPDSIKDEYLNTPVVLTDLKIYNKSVQISPNSILKESITASKTITIPPGNDDITIEFALLDYFNPKGNSFKYKLEGFDRDWNLIGNRNTATYTNLPAGSYTFIVKASNGDFQNNNDEASLNIIVVPVFYQTWWFRIVFAFGIIMATFLFIHERTRSIRKQNKVLENRVAERTKDLDKTINELNQEISERKKAEEKVQASLDEKEVLLKEIHHRVKNNLQMISSLLYLQSRTINDNSLLNLFQDSQNRIKSMALIHEKLYLSKDFARVNFYEYVKSLLDHLIQSYKKNDFNMNVHIKINKDLNLDLDTAICCGMIINELITNAFKYAFPYDWAKQKSLSDELYLEISSTKIDENYYTMSVKDNGIGIPEGVDIQHSISLGLKIVNSMVSQLDGSIEILRNDGTQFLIKFYDTK